MTCCQPLCKSEAVENARSRPSVPCERSLRRTWRTRLGLGAVYSPLEVLPAQDRPLQQLAVHTPCTETKAPKI